MIFLLLRRGYLLCFCQRSKRAASRWSHYNLEKVLGNARQDEAGYGMIAITGTNILSFAIRMAGRSSSRTYLPNLLASQRMRRIVWVTD